MIENAPTTPILPDVNDYRSSVLAQLNVKHFAITSPVGVSPKPKSRRSTGPTKVKGAPAQADVKQKPMHNPVGHPSQTGAIVRGCGVSVRGRSRRTTGGKPRGAESLVLYSCGSGSTIPEVQGPSNKRSSAVAKQRSKRTIVDSSDDARKVY